MKYVLLVFLGCFLSSACSPPQQQDTPEISFVQPSSTEHPDYTTHWNYDGFLIDSYGQGCGMNLYLSLDIPSAIRFGQWVQLTPNCKGEDKLGVFMLECGSNSDWSLTNCYPDVYSPHDILCDVDVFTTGLALIKACEYREVGGIQ